MENATQTGASIQERLMAVLDDTPQEETQAVTETEELDAVEVEENDETTEEIEASDDDQDEETTEDVQEDERSLALSDIAAALGLDEDKLDVDEDGNLFIKTKIDGEEGRAKPLDLIKNYQLEGHLNKQNMEVAEQKKALQNKLQEVEQTTSQRLNELEDLAKIAWADLNLQMQNVNWDELDSGERAELKIQFQERQQRLLAMYNQVQGQRKQNEGLSEERKQQILYEERGKLLNAIPEWNDSEVFSKEAQKIAQYARSIGYSDDELDSTLDHRMFVLARKAILFDTLQSKKPEVTKKVRTAPKIAKPGQPKSPGEEKTIKLKKQRENIRKTGGKTGDIASFLLATGKV